MSTLTLQEAPDYVLGAQFSRATTVQAFCEGWLACQCDLIPEIEGGLVLLGPPDGGPFVPIAVRPGAPRSIKHLAAAAEQALQQRSGVLLHRLPDGDPAAPWPGWYEVAYLIEVTGRLHGVVVFTITPASPLQLQAVLQQLSLGTGWLEVLMYRQQSLAHMTTQGRLQAVLDVLATVVEHEEFYAAAAAFVTDLATRLVCERVSLGVVHGQRVRLETMSHSSQVDKQTNLTCAIEDAMEEALDQAAVVVYPSRANAACQMTRMHEELARQHGAGAICSVLLGRHERIFGVLTFERPADTTFDMLTVELCEAIAALAGPVLAARHREAQWLAVKAVNVLRTQLSRLIGPRHIALKLASVGLVVALIFFALAKADYRVVATTFIEAQTQRVAVAPFDGYITAARVRAGDLVQAEDILCTLDDRDLKLAQLKWHSQKEQYVKQYHLAMAQGNAAQVKIITAQIAQAEAELALVQDQLVRTQVRAPFAGVVVSGDLSQSVGAPVERGQVLFKVAPLDTYRVLLQVDERDTAEVAVGQRGHLVLSALPTDPLPFTIDKITPVSVAREGRNYFRVEAQLDHTPPHLRPGLEGVGKITIGRRLLLWNWTRRGIDWLRLFAWSWWP
ncbi:MAG TPA: HlyD family efflux transporter periplasmic adaptor subunit [Candidatus Tectomicrobia bacterium]|jgi:multidrug resistance efflux pump